MIIILPAGGFAECSVCLILAVSTLKEVVVLHQKLVQGGLGAAKLSADLEGAELSAAKELIGSFIKMGFTNIYASLCIRFMHPFVITTTAGRPRRLSSVTASVPMVSGAWSRRCIVFRRNGGRRRRRQQPPLKDFYMESIRTSRALCCSSVRQFHLSSNLR